MSEIQDRDIYDVSRFLAEARRLLEASYPFVWIEGEISTLRQPASGHAYFALKDENSQIRCAFFRRERSRSSYKPQEGDLVRIRARVTLYEARGDFQLIVQDIEEAGEGILLRRFEELKKKLSAEGLFDFGKKQAIPEFPRTVGIITSPSGAAVRDIITTMGRRFPSTRLIIYPSTVQGDTAADEIRAALATAIRHARADVLILARGGGSLEDLWCFNDEQLARDIVACSIPVISAVGHEVDFTISDFVADQRAPTPTAAAELVSPDRGSLEKTLGSASGRLVRAIHRHIQSLAQKTDWFQQALNHPGKVIEISRERLLSLAIRQEHSVKEALSHRRSQLGTVEIRLAPLHPVSRLRDFRERIHSYAARIYRAQRTLLTIQQTRKSALSDRLSTVSPLGTLERGYAIARIPQQGSVIRTVNELEKERKLDVQISDGTVHCRVDSITRSEKPSQ